MSEPDLSKYPEECKCGTSLRWAITVNGKGMPLNATPNEERGNFSFLPGSETHIESVKPGAREFGDTRPRYLTHFAECEYASEFRRRHPAHGEH